MSEQPATGTQQQCYLAEPYPLHLQVSIRFDAQIARRTLVLCIFQVPSCTHGKCAFLRSLPSLFNG